MAHSKFLIIGIALAIVIAIVVLSLYLYISSQASALEKQLAQTSSLPTGPLYGTASHTGTSILTYNNSKYIVESTILSYYYPNATSGNITLNMYYSNPAEKIYLVNVGFSCFKCVDEDSINQSLAAYLEQYGLILNASSFSYINLTAVPGLPRNSIIIVPSGLMPSVLLPASGANPNQARTDIIDLLNRGDTILYVGYNFSRSIENGINYISSNQTLAALLQAKINTTAATRTRTYVTANSFYFNSPSFAFFDYPQFGFNGSTYGPVAYVKSENGTLIAFSNYPSAGWANASELSHDIAFALYSRFWMPLLSQSQTLPAPPNNGTVPIFTTKMPIRSTSLVNRLINSSYSLIELQLFNSSGAWIVKELPFRARFQNNGTLGLPAVIGEGQSVPISLYVGGSQPKLHNVTVGNSTKNALLFHIEVYNSTESYIYSLPVGFFNTSLGVVIYATFAFKPGYYYASLRDINNKIYENALFYLPQFNITPVLLNFKNGTFLFSVINNNQSVSGIPYQGSINGEYQQTGEISRGVLNYTLTKGSILSYGKQVIQLDILNTSYTLSSNYSKPASGGIPPLYIEFGVAGAAILILNLLIKAPTRDEYFIDVPLFPPTPKIEVKTTASAILGIFGTVNDRFGWKYMPLTAEEVKSGVSSDIRYNNMPIMITIENSTEVLYKLVNSNEVELIQPYFMPSKWEQESGHDIEYLVIFRKLRDFAVKNAILFTNLDAAENADMMITNRGVQSYLHIYSSRSSMKDIKLTAGMRVFIVFLGAETRAQFLDKLSDTYGTEAEKLRMEVAASSIILIDTENLEQLLY